MTVQGYDDINRIATVLSGEGFDTYLVGGAVRDLTLGHTPKDLDLATDARPEQITAALTPVVDAVLQVGAEFGVVVAVLGDVQYEIATFRGDVYDGETRKPTVEYTDSIRADLARRDFTINAMAYKLPFTIKGTTFGDTELIDPFGGYDDLTNYVLRTPGSTRQSFLDDPLRMMRAARFIARFNLVPDVKIEDEASRLFGDLERVSTERIND